MVSEDTKILGFNQYENPTILIMQILDLCLKKIDDCKYNPEKSTTIKIGKHMPCRNSASTIWTLDGIKNKHDVKRGRDCMKLL